MSEVNPVFYDWTKIYIPYCDGSTHQGYRETPVNYRGRDLYFRGTQNTLEHFSYLDKNYDFYNKDTIVVSGGSAGGEAAYDWV